MADGRTDGRADGQSGDYIYDLPSGSIKVHIPIGRETKLTESYKNTTMLDCMFTANDSGLSQVSVYT